MVNKIQEVIGYLLLASVIFVPAFGLGTLYSKPMFVLERWRNAYKDQKLELLKCQETVRDLEIQRLETNQPRLQ